MHARKSRPTRLPPILIRQGIILLLLALMIFTGWFTMIRMPLTSYTGPWLPLAPREIELREELRRHVGVLAGQIGERNVFRPEQLAGAVEYIESSFGRAGYAVKRISCEVSGQLCHNLEATLPGASLHHEIVVIGAHYDSVHGSPGANDNGSGVAALLALAGRLRPTPSARTVRFVAFTNEEPPFFQTENMGSLVYARHCRERGDNIVAMLSVETIGYYSDQRGSQQYPPPVGFFYPNRGNFIAFVGNIRNRGLVRSCIASFRRQGQFPSEGAALPGWLTGIDWSDHWSFWQTGYPAIMITDTAVFRYPYYHLMQDTPDKLDFDRMARVVANLEQVIRELGNE